MVSNLGKEAAEFASNRALIASTLFSDRVVRASENMKDCAAIAGGSVLVTAMVVSHVAWPAWVFAGGAVLAFLSCRETNALEEGSRQTMLRAVTKVADAILSTKNRISHNNMIADGMICRIQSVEFSGEYLNASDCPGGSAREAFFGRISGLFVKHTHVSPFMKSRFQLECVSDQTFRIKSVPFDDYLIVLRDGRAFFARQDYPDFEEVSLLTLKSDDAAPGRHHTQIRSTKWDTYLVQDRSSSWGKRGVTFSQPERSNEPAQWVVIEECVD